jgi:thiamine-monophosphate kinase
MMDLSDGLATDLGHICQESGVGARVRVDRLPIAPAVREVAEALGRNAVEWAAAGGEDYELLVTCSPGAAEDLARGLQQATGTPLTVVGEIETQRGEPIWLGSRGEPVVVRGGYEHFSG